MSIRTTRNSRRFIAAAAAVAVAASSFIATSSPVSAAAAVTENTRIAGADRYATANAVALAKSTAVAHTSLVLVSGENFPDGLAASSLAGALNAPMLLTQSETLPISVLASITAMRAAHQNFTKIVIVGGTSAVSAGIAAQLTALGLTVTRIAGADRYTTANAVAAATRANNANTVIGTFGEYRTAFLASGTNFPDALAASAQAYKGKHPIFLTNGSTLTDETKAAMIAAGVQQVIILGGTSAVSAEVATAVAGVTGVITSTRIEGATRYDTATALATALGAAVGGAAFKTKAFLVSGTDFPDALVSAQLAGGATGGGAIIPVTSPLPAAVTTWVTANQSTLTNIQAIGGISAVSVETVTAVKTGATIAKPTATIAAADGSSTATVTFSAPLTTGSATGGAETLTSYTRSTALGAVSNPTGVNYTFDIGTGVSSAVLTFGAPVLTPGDVIGVVANAINHATNGTTVAGATTTVVLDATAPSATIVAYSGAAAAANKVWVTFSSNTNGSTFANTDLVHLPQGINATAATFTCTDFGTFASTLTKSCAIVGQAVAVGDVIRIPAAAIGSNASTAVVNAVINATVVADTTAPVLQTVRYSQSAVGGVQASLGNVGTTSAGVLKITAKAGTAPAGKNGNTWQVATVFSGVGVVSVAVNSTTKIVTVTSGVTNSAIAVANTLNTTAAFSALFLASEVTAGALTGFTTGQLPMSGGRDKLTLTLTFSEALAVATIGALTIDTVRVTDQSGAAITAVASTNNGLLTGVLTATVLTSGAPLAGVSTVTVGVGVTDRNSVALAVNGVSNVVTMIPAA